MNEPADHSTQQQRPAHERVFFLGKQMAQRYGRNQRRRAREQITALQRSRNAERELLSQAKHETQELATALDEARYILGDSAALPPRAWGDHPADDQDSFMVAPHEPPSFVTLQAETVSRKLLQMHLLVTQIEQRRFGVPGLHCRVRLAGGDWAYAVSESALRKLPTDALRRRLVRELSIQLAASMANHFSARR